MIRQDRAKPGPRRPRRTPAVRPRAQFRTSGPDAARFTANGDKARPPTARQEIRSPSPSSSQAVTHLRQNRWGATGEKEPLAAAADGARYSPAKNTARGCGRSLPRAGRRITLRSVGTTTITTGHGRHQGPGVPPVAKMTTAPQGVRQTGGLSSGQSACCVHRRSRSAVKRALAAGPPPAARIP